MDTEFIIKSRPELIEIIDKYNLSIRVDDFGMSYVVFYNAYEVGYWFGNEMHYTVNFGSYVDTINTYCGLVDSWKMRIEEYLNNKEMN